MFRTAKQYLKDEMDIDLPDGIVNGTWFAKHHLPKMVRCTCCDTIMTLPSAKIRDDGTIYCSTCIE